MKNDEFYIGWMNNAPKSFAGTIKKYLLVLLAIIIVLGVLLALSQKKFGTGNFEFGKNIISFFRFNPLLFECKGNSQLTEVHSFESIVHPEQYAPQYLGRFW